MVPSAAIVLAASTAVDSLMYGNGLQVRVARCPKFLFLLLHPSLSRFFFMGKIETFLLLHNLNEFAPVDICQLVDIAMHW